jgi:endonuclease/exonuclease/phosphatase family metal-dependent hydrolase
MQPGLKVLILLVTIMLFSACDPFKTRLQETDVVYYAAESPQIVPVTDTLKVMTWNIKFGGARIDFFFDCFGDRAIMTGDEVLENMAGVAGFINETKPDILFLQEIDINSKRAAFIDQVQWLLDNSHFQYAVYTPQWKASHIPTDGLGRINSGVAIFSRWPLKDARRIALPLIKEQSALVRYFYLKRCLLECIMDVNGKEVVLLNTHTEPYAMDGTKKRQLDQILTRLQYLDSIGSDFILAGDLNALPPGTVKTHGFPDSVCPPGEFEADDYSGETDWMMPYYEQFMPAVPLKEYMAHNERYYTHTVDGRSFWNRKVDYIFTNRAFVPGSDMTFQSVENGGIDTMPLSDHCALMVEYLLLTE